MALSSKARKVLEVGLANRSVAREIADAIDTGSNSAADSVMLIGTTSDLVAPSVIGDAAPLLGTETRLDAVESKIDELINALKAVGLMV
jgi:hypothetical protein